jgi:hypothetical protein
MPQLGDNIIIHSFIHLFHIPLIFTDVELVIFIINIEYKQVNIVIPYTKHLTQNKTFVHIFDFTVYRYWNKVGLNRISVN